MSVEDFTRGLPDSMSKGQKALEALSAYRAARQPVPDEVLRQIDNCYRHFTEGRPVALRPLSSYSETAAMTLGEAFGVPDHRGGSKAALKRRRLALAQPRLVAMFKGIGRAKTASTREGYQAAATELKLTVSEVEDWVSANVASRRIRK